MPEQISWNFFKERAGHIWEAIQGGKVIGRSSQTFRSKSGAEYNARLMGYENSYGEKLDWEFLNEKKGWKWRVISSVNFEEVGSSNKHFTTQKDAEENAHIFGYRAITGLPKSEPASRWFWCVVAALALMSLLFAWPAIANFLGFNQKPGFSRVVDTGSTTEFAKLAKLAGIDSDLTTQKTFTLFAPDNTALKALPQEVIAKLQQLANRPILRDLLRSHITPERVDLNMDGEYPTLLASQKISIQKRDGRVLINGAEGIDANQTPNELNNGKMYVLPFVLPSSDLLSKLVDVPDVSPTPESISSQSVNESSSVVSVPILTPTPSPISTPTPTPTQLPLSALSILETKADLSTLLTALRATGLDQFIASNDVTVFAPTNDAFVEMTGLTTAELLLPENKEVLSNILRYHVVLGTKTAEMLATMTTVSPVLGTILYVDTVGGITLISAGEPAEVVLSNLKAQRGVVHVIDRVLLPFTTK